MVLVLNAVPMKIHFLGCERHRQPGAPGCPYGEKLFMKAQASIMVPSREMLVRQQSRLG
jgi:hypothetical protein